MKKLFLFCVILLSVLTGCQKDITNTDATTTGVEKVMQTPSKENMDIKKNGDPSLTFDQLNVKVKVENGILAFETMADLSETVNFLGNATPVEVAKWEKNLNGFQSVFRNYMNAKKELMETDDIELVKAKYQGKVKFDGENSIESLIRIGKIFGSMMNELGMYRVENILVAYDDNDNHFSILDGNLETLKLAKLTLRTDTSRGIYIHKVHGDINKLDNTQVTQRNMCNSTCPVSHQETVKSSNGKFRLRNVYDYEDNTVGSSQQILAMAGFSVQVDHEAKKWYGWAGDRSGFTWGFGWGLTLMSQLGTKGVSSGGQFPIIGISQGGWTWTTNEAFLNEDIIIINESWTVANGMSQSDINATRPPARLKNCLGRTGLVSRSNLKDGNRVVNENQFCWSNTNL